MYTACATGIILSFLYRAETPPRVRRREYQRTFARQTSKPMHFEATIAWVQPVG